MSGRQAIDGLIQPSILSFQWIDCSVFRDIELSEAAAGKIIYCIGRWHHKMILLLLGNDETCTPEFISEFARKYSLPPHRYRDDVSLDNNQFRRYTEWLRQRSALIEGFTEYEGNYYMVAKRPFQHYYSRY